MDIWKFIEMFRITRPLGILMTCFGIFMAAYGAWSEMLGRCEAVASHDYCLGRSATPAEGGKE